MRRFLKKTAIFALIIVLLLSFGEIVCRQLPTSYSYKNYYLENYGSSINTLVLGSSHTYYGIIPALLNDSCFNLANISQSPEYDLRLLEHYYPMCPNLKCVIIPISYFTFTDLELEDTDEWRLCINYKIGNKLNYHSDFSKYNFEISSFQTYTGKLSNLFLKQKSNQCDSLGFGIGFNLQDRPDDWQLKAYDRVSYLTAFRPARQDEVFGCIEHTILFCKQRNIEVVLVTTPVWTSFRENMDSAQYERMLRCANELAQRHNIHYYNMFGSNMFDEDDFHDVDHLSDAGAEKFTTLLDSFFQADCISTRRR